MLYILYVKASGKTEHALRSWNLDSHTVPSPTTFPYLQDAFLIATPLIPGTLGPLIFAHPCPSIPSRSLEVGRVKVKCMYSAVLQGGA